MSDLNLEIEGETEAHRDYLPKETRDDYLDTF